MQIKMFLKHSARFVRNVKTLSTHGAVLDIKDEVGRALRNSQAVVALESTIITHGMPYPQNLETALKIEEIVRKHDAVPATIAILNGRIKVGLAKNEIVEIASKNQKDVVKCSRRDLPYVVATKQTGGTTVAGTMIISHMAGIKVFATGGIGGVHFEGENTLDISADLIELGRTPVAVVCSGIKSILDIPRTLECLETQGVCVCTYSDADKHFPDFYTRDSGCTVPYNLENPTNAAKLIQTLHDLNLKSGILIAVPIPAEHAANKSEIKAAIEAATAAAKRQGVVGKEVTPFLLDAIARLTKGNSLAANMALIENNAAVAAQIASELCRKGKVEGIFLQPAVERECRPVTPLVIGASILDLSLRMDDDLPRVLDGATYQTTSKQTAGGVGRNLAEGIFKLYGSANLISIVGNDFLGKTLLASIPDALQACIEVAEDAKTSMCSVLFDKLGDCKLILGNMEIHRKISPELIMKYEQLFFKAPLIVMDANISVSAIKCVLGLAQKYNKPVFYEPTDMRIADKAFRQMPPHLMQQIKFLSPNIFELKKIVEAISGRQVPDSVDMTGPLDKILDHTKSHLQKISKTFDCAIVTLGHHGILACLHPDMAFDQEVFDAKTGRYLMGNQSETPELKNHTFRYYAAPRLEQIENVSGAGDSFSSGFVAGLLRGKTIEESIIFGFLAAECSLKSESAIPKTFFTDKELDLFCSQKKQKLQILDL